MSSSLYQKAASFYGSYRPQYPKELIDFISKLLKEKTTYLDIGCGTGELLFKLAPAFKAATGVDVDENMLAFGKEKKKKDNLKHVILVQEKAENFLRKTSPDSWDLITAGRTIHWMDQAFVIQKTYEALKPEGIFVLVGDAISLWNRVSPPFILVRELIRSFEKKKQPPHKIAGGKDTSFQLTLNLLKQSPFKTHKQTKISIDSQWDSQHILNYFYSASGFLEWLGKEREEFQEKAIKALSSLPSASFNAPLEFGLTYCKKE
jgi:SAM-dependent methyltransferase